MEHLIPNKFIAFFLKIFGLLLIAFKKKKHKEQNFNQRLINCLSDIGPIYVKFGQTLSTRPDIIGDEMAESLRLLQDKLPPFDFKIVQKILTNSFGQNLSEIFASFDENPVASASIAQVYKAVLPDNKVVAIKILRPNIRTIYERDIKLLKFLAKFARFILKDASRLKPMAIVKEFEDTMHQELDLMLEAAAASEMRDNAKNDPNIVIPRVYWNYTNSNILTTEWIDGISIYDKSSLKKAGLNYQDIASNIAVMFFNQAYRDGFFHADLHPGNVLVCKDGKIGLVDFGIVGRLEEKDRLAIAEILHAFIKRDYIRVAEIHIEAGYVPENTNIYLFAQSCRTIGEQVVGASAKEIKVGKLLGQLFKMTSTFGMETQPQLLLVQKTTVVVEGIGRMIDPDVNLWKLAEPWIKRWAARNISPEAKLLRLVRVSLKKLFCQN